MTEICVEIRFTSDPKFTYSYPISQSRFGSGLEGSGLYERIMEKTHDNHERAESVISWAELASVGETYETDDLTAEIVED